MRALSALDVRARFGQVIDEAAAGERIVVERGGQPIAAIVPLTDLAALDPEAERDRKLAALSALVRMAAKRVPSGREHAESLIRTERDRGHRA